MPAPVTVSSRPAVVAARRRRRRGSGLFKLVLAVLVLVLGAFLVAAGAVVAEARQYDDTRTDAIVVLGAAQYDGQPSPVFANRLDYAAELYRDGIAPVVITVGGGMAGDLTTEAASGEAYLAAKGLPADSLVSIPKGSDTITSLQAVAARADRAGWDQITVVSDRAHLARSAAIMQALGFEAHVNGPASGDGALLTPEYVAKEALGLLRFQLWDRWRIAG